MSRLIFIGIDALDAEQVEKYSSYLPNIMRLRQSGYYAKLSSTWPPDSDTAWASIYTGLNPARHGIFKFVDPLEKSMSYSMEEPDNSAIKGRTFWDIAGDADKRVCVLFPHIGYPSWPVNGVMISRASTTEDISIHPLNLGYGNYLTGLNSVKGLVGRNPERYLKATQTMVNRQLELNLQLFEREDWDLFFTYWSALDLIQHQFWNYCDPSDPTYRSDNNFRSVIRDFYILHDKVVGALMERIDSNTTLLLMSDHGHGMRPVKLFNINRLLREHGLLVLREGGLETMANILRTVKKNAMDLVTRHNLGDLASRTLKFAPWMKRAYISSNEIDLDNTVAYITDMSGIKAYSYGGIQIVKKNLLGRSYSECCEEIIKLMLEVQNPDGGDRRVVRWIRHRDELYTGPYIEEYPDLVFELEPDYGAGWDASGHLFTVSPSHTLYPGSHLGRNAIFLLYGPRTNDIQITPNSLMDIAPTVLNILGLVSPAGLDGVSIFGKSKSH